ncbi:hypothetical protein AKJ16_DCAP20579 [Drosera capensis]
MFHTISPSPSASQSHSRINRKWPRRNGSLAYPVWPIERGMRANRKWEYREAVRRGGDAGEAVASAAGALREMESVSVMDSARNDVSVYMGSIKSSSSCFLFIAVTVVAAVKGLWDSELHEKEVQRG